MKSVLRPLQPGDIEAICANPRAADVREMQAQGKEFEEALRESVELSDLLGVGELDGVPVCIFGLAMGSYISGLGVPWMLAAEGLDRADFAFARRCLAVVRAMRARYPRLVNVVDARSRRTIAWLRWVGFHIHQEPVRVNGYRFHVFSIGVRDV